MRQLFNTGKGSPIMSFFLTLKGRRLMFLWNILNKSDKENIKQVFKTQLLFPVKNDWVNIVKKVT